MLKLHLQGGKQNAMLVLQCVLVMLLSASALSAQNSIKTKKLKISADKSHSLILETHYYNDTLDEMCGKYNFISPIIISQTAYFIINDSVVAKRSSDKIPFHKHKYKSKEIRIQTTPIFDIEVNKCDNRLYYSIYGASYCCGLGCPEYIGLYELDGTLLWEAIGAYNYEYYTDKGNEIKYKIDWNNPIAERSIFNMFVVGYQSVRAD